MIQRIFMGALCLCLTLGVFSHAAGAAGKTQVLSAAELLSMLKQAEGKVVMINFFASWCPPCREEIPGLVNLKKRYREGQVVFIGLSVDHDPDELEAFIAGQAFNYPIFQAEADLAHMYGVRSIPHNAIHNKKGELVANQPGFIEERDLRRVLDALVRSK